MMEALILVATFLGVLLVSALVIGKIAGRREVSSRLAEAAVEGGPSDNRYLDQVAGTVGNEDSAIFRYYFDVIRNNKDKNSLANRLIRAGYFSPNAIATFQVIRAASVLLVIFALFLLFDIYFVAVPRSWVVAIC